MDLPPLAIDPADQERFTRLWTTAQPAISNYIASLVPNFHEGEDLLQNVAVVLLRKFANYDSARPFVAWAMGVARNEILVRRRTFARSKVVISAELVETIAEVAVEMQPELDARGRALRDCMKDLGERAEQVVNLRYAEALEPRDIAKRVGLSPGAVRVMLSRIRSALHTCIERRVVATGEQ